MKHLGDITKINGWEIEPVDCVTGGSPCQDLSVAGKRAGLAGARSGLFMEQVRVVKELRERDRASGRSGVLIRPRYMVWENVPGAFSSNKGQDFRAVLEEIVRIAEPDAPDVPMPAGGWPHSGCLYDELGRWSVAWRVHDAQYWGVPQRRKRICVLADFNGFTAPWILFDPQFERTTEGGEPVSIVGDFGNEPRPEIQLVSESVSGDSEPCGAAGEGTAAGAERGFGETGQGFWQRGIQTIRAEGENRPSRPGNVVVDDSAICLQGNGIDRAGTAGCNGRGWRRGGPTPSTPSTDRQSTISFQERAGKPGGAKASSSSVNTQEPCQRSITKPYTLPINTMVATRDTPETRTTFGVGEPDDPQFTLSAAHEHAVFSAAFMGGQGSKAGSIAYSEEISPSIKAVPSGGNTVPDVMVKNNSGAYAVDCRNGK